MAIVREIVLPDSHLPNAEKAQGLVVCPCGKETLVYHGRRGRSRGGPRRPRRCPACGARISFSWKNARAELALHLMSKPDPVSFTISDWADYPLFSQTVLTGPQKRGGPYPTSWSKRGGS